MNDPITTAQQVCDRVGSEHGVKLRAVRSSELWERENESEPQIRIWFKTEPPRYTLMDLPPADMDAGTWSELVESECEAVFYEARKQGAGT